MHRELAHDWTLIELANIAAMSRSQFAERFRLLVGEPPMSYLARWRMLKARELLLSSERPIVDIASTVGYRSEFSFSRAFKKILGVSPGAIRRQITMT